MNDWQEKVIERLKNGTPVRQLARELCIPRRTIRSFIERKNIKTEIAEELKVKCKFTKITSKITQQTC